MSEEITTLRNFLELVEASLDLSEPTALDDDCSVASVSPVKGGLVGLDVDTGRPVHVGWKYKTIDEKPVIINAGGKQTIIPPKPPPPPEPAHIVDVVMAGALYTEMRARFQPSDYMTEVDVGAKNAFVKGCLANPEFYMKWRARLAVLEAKEKFMCEGQPKSLPPRGGWPSPPRARQRIVDT
jgi:hypothetical protein